MNFSTYASNARRTAKPLSSEGMLLHAALGVTSEAGEFATLVKRLAIYGKQFDEQMGLHLREELGDMLWFISHACDALGMDLENVALANIAKLRERFPDAYSDTAAEARADKNGADSRSS